MGARSAGPAAAQLGRVLQRGVWGVTRPVGRRGAGGPPHADLCGFTDGFVGRDGNKRWDVQMDNGTG
jgi:hypothetical protein